MPDAVQPDARDGSATGELPVTIVIPLYNEERILDENLATLARFFDALLGSRNWLFLLVENGSSDGTPARIGAALERWPMSRALHLPEPNYGAALKAGLLAATTRWVFMFDIEQWDLPFASWAWRNREGHDVFIGSKRADPTLNGQEFYRRVLSCGLNGLLQLFFGYSGTDTHGPKLLDRAALGPIIAACALDRGQFDTELVLRAMRAGKRMIEAPIEYRELRPARNWMVKKIVWNVFALRRLVRVMKDVPFEGPALYYRVARADLIAATSAVERAREASFV